MNGALAQASTLFRAGAEVVSPRRRSGFWIWRIRAAPMETQRSTIWKLYSATSRTGSVSNGRPGVTLRPEPLAVEIAWVRTENSARPR